MTLKDQITEDMKSAMRAKETARLGAIRLLLAAIKQREVDERIVVDDAGVIATVEKMIKQRKDSISQFEKAGRDDLVAIEVGEMTILQAYLPAQLSDAEVEAAVTAAVASTGAVGPQDMGKVIGRSGNTAKAIRTLLRVVGMKHNARVKLKINEPAGGRSSEQGGGSAATGWDGSHEAEAVATPQMKSIDEAMDNLGNF